MGKAADSGRDSPLRCAFCQKTQKAVGKLISSPSSHPRVYICDECVAVCAAIIEDDRQEVEAGTPAESETPHPLLSHRLVSELMACVVQWIRQESLGVDASDELGRLRSVAARMVSDTGSA
jgi:ATP-dependent protease Clp ATPase subunit